MFASANGIGYLPLLTLPWLIGSLVRDRGYSDSAAGVIATAELGALAVTTIVVGAIVHRFSRRALCLSGACIAIVSSAALSIVSQTLIVITLLGATGVGCGMCSAAGNSLLSFSKDPSRLTAHLWALAILWQTIVWFVTPLIVQHWKLPGLCALLVAGFAVYLPMMPRMPDLVSSGVARAVRARRFSIAIVLPIFLCSLAFWLRDSVTWSLAERRGLLLGITEYHLGLTFTAASLLGLLGPLAADHLGMRSGRMKTVIGGLAFIGIVMQVIASAASPVQYQAGFLLWTGASIFAWTYVMEMAAVLDPEGRVPAICGGIVFVAGACGPMLGGVLLEWGGRTTLPSVVSLLTAVTLLAAYLAARRPY